MHIAWQRTGKVLQSGRIRRLGQTHSTETACLLCIIQAVYVMVMYKRDQAVLRTSGRCQDVALVLNVKAISQTGCRWLTSISAMSA